MTGCLQGSPSPCQARGFPFVLILVHDDDPVFLLVMAICAAARLRWRGTGGWQQIQADPSIIRLGTQ